MLSTLKDTSTEVGELEAKVKGKEQMIASLQEEILSMTVRKELLSSAVEKVQHRHQEQVEQVACQRREIEAKISEYAVLAPTSKVYYVVMQMQTGCPIWIFTISLSIQSFSKSGPDRT